MHKQWRQVLHLEPPQGWLNDPNGLCYFHGLYHVFFQYSPDSADGDGRKCWGHYVTRDFLTWDFVGTELFPDTPEDKDGVYSGSAIIVNDTMELFYTGNVKEPGNHDYITSGRGANVIRVSSKDGRHFSEKQVLLRNKDYPAFCSCHVRDPKLWEENGTYYMVLGARKLDDTGCVIIYRSDDLTHWDYVKTLSIPNFGYMWECPDHFEINGKVYLSVSPQGLEHGTDTHQNVYSSGYFQMDGDTLHDFREWDYGFDFYAPQTFQAPDGRRILIGWMGIGDIPYQNPTTELGWQHCLTLPREITVAEDGVLLQNPIKELAELRQSPLTLSEDTPKNLTLPFEICTKTPGNFTIVLDENVKIGYNNDRLTLTFTDSTIGGGRDVRNAVVGSCRDVRIIADRSSLEIYLDGGRVVMSTRFYPKSPEVQVQANGITPTIYPLKEMELNQLGE